MKALKSQFTSKELLEFGMILGGIVLGLVL